MSCEISVWTGRAICIPTEDRGNEKNDEVVNVVCVEQHEQFFEVWVKFHRIAFATAPLPPAVPRAACSASSPGHAF